MVCSRVRYDLDRIYCVGGFDQPQEGLSSMGFFDKLAEFVINLVISIWGFMKMFAGMIINSTFGWYTGKPISEDMAALFVYGAILFAIACYLFFSNTLKFKS